jgi:hypothetical protein
MTIGLQRTDVLEIEKEIRSHRVLYNQQIIICDALLWSVNMHKKILIADRARLTENAGDKGYENCVRKTALQVESLVKLHQKFLDVAAGYKVTTETLLQRKASITHV